ncbi:unnamed protein product [Lepeophtheirus salmonis]|uniref:(salmon louse) hypothetical protein n=1 Tax=Lepeophtheirus salmonis TaxID=72036 RepID=A0A7R8D671_LEPSM|nr:unnamed protein product [Lepeophtheirus salmonis]CAF3038078.1 unnamed protein product [Lepeophtheirus salmonis]
MNSYLKIVDVSGSSSSNLGSRTECASLVGALRSEIAGQSRIRGKSSELLKIFDTSSFSVALFGVVVSSVGTAVSGSGFFVPSVGGAVSGFGVLVPSVGDSVSGFGVLVPSVGDSVSGFGVVVPSVGGAVSGSGVVVPSVGGTVSGFGVLVPSVELYLVLGSLALKWLGVELLVLQ